MAEDKVTAVKRALVLNPFVYHGENPNVSVDPVIRRHAGQEIKTGLTYPIGLGYIAAVLLDAGQEVRLLDPIAQPVSVDAIRRDAEWSDAIFIPYTSPHSTHMAEFFSEFRHKLRVTMGAIAENLYEDLLNRDFADVILIGEPEETVAELAAQYPDLSDIRGIAYRTGGGEVVRNPPRPLIEDLDAVPFPYRGFGNQRGYWDIPFFGQPTACVLPARGCPFGCIYCAQWQGYQRTYRKRSPANVVDEIERVVAEQGIRCINFHDPTFNVDADFNRALCEEIIRRGLDIEWFCSARADLVEEDVLRLMKRSGCIEVQYGVESADDAILNQLGRGTTIDRIREGIDITRKVGIPFSLYCIFGSRLETAETVEKTMRFVREVKPLFVSFNVLTPLPGSRLFIDVKDKLDLDQDMQNFDILHTDYVLGEFSAKELTAIVRRAYRSYYLSIRFACMLLRKCIEKPKLFYWMMKSVPRQALYLCKSVFLRGEKA
ncbi:MAG: radical SAM protein [Kiritimatiellia bacterium]|jgi:radical SAM superfamily enzyme YgiQ (UPF0313 family)|nr:radical SAM protein [Kiritimatiellia bacterium]